MYTTQTYVGLSYLKQIQQGDQVPGNVQPGNPELFSKARI